MPKSIIEDALGSNAPADGVGADKGSQERSAEELEIERIAEGLNVCIKLVGCGGAGSNTVNRFFEQGVSGVQTLAINTDAKHLLSVKASRKILIGKNLTRGLGAGAKPEVGERAAMENERELQDFVKGSQIVFVTAGMGGGTGTSSSFVVSRLAREAKALTVGVVTLPFKSEGEMRMENATEGLSRLAKVCDTTIVIPNDTLLELVPNLPVQAAFKVADELLLQTICGLTEMLTKAGLVNVDYADLRTILDEGGVSLIGVGEGEGAPLDRMATAVDEALTSPLLGRIDLKDAKGALVRVVGGPDMTIEEAAKAAEIISSKLRPDGRLIWGCSLEQGMEGRVKVLLIVTGARSQYVLLRDGTEPVIRRTSEDYRGAVNVPSRIHEDEDTSFFVR
ncbi:MAG: cell division protein FtsZ [Candidatus Thermoplasmatota archaeon]